jgi:formylglycine-generating enzyme
MVWIEAGKFRMGSDSRYPEEAPAHWVNVDGFFIDLCPVTNRQFAVIDHDKNVGTVLKALDHAAARRAEIVPILIVGNRGGL